ncbi:4'-phosphopantetheinyl transferase superfamily protein [Erwiniaceae bacterium BAC15a-03b]|uniref:Enterobactin synthase component D n=1 Tax=Winslowiella arboricola TaxID=2978220 RepID=A0A9J6PST3_9GAMM|nr:4'-phosphopantetheinyl transferase superfamily protein [Winslowiella arboricola]MCU5773142.1 4'-phosphopantetheinyl transferase superfamily protein [Winslowiella arboricola]MCU5778725.1 4'-phosphopantetheinyl transferase superfamily protein [Winslowiella arboricola]
MLNDFISLSYPPTPFIHTLRQITVPQFPWLRLTEIRFALHHFDDSLFALLAIDPPAHLGKSVKKRRAEYLASRYAARSALAAAGVDDFLLLNDEQRAPIWPPGFCGSLSHTSQRAVIITAAAQPGRRIGVDAEQTMQAESARELSEMIVSASELQRLKQCGLPLAQALTLTFSLKESLYKALFPVLRQFMDFHSAEIVGLEGETGRAQLRLTRDFSAELQAGRLFSGYFQQQQDEITTLIIDEL